MYDSICYVLHLKLFPSTLFLDEFHNFLSNTRIKFTREMEDDSKISFLDVAIGREPACLSLGVYRKPTHSNRYIHPYSYAPKQFVQSTLVGMKLRAMRYCTDELTLHNELSFVEDIFVQFHGWDRYFVQKQLSIKKFQA